MRISGWKVPVDHLSASSISKLVTCPEMWRLRYIRHTPEVFGVEKFIGIVDHDTISYDLTAKMGTKTNMTTTEMMNTYDHIWEMELQSEEPNWRDLDEQETKQHSMLVMLAYHELISPKIQPIKVEERFELEIHDVPVPLIGYTDIEERDKLIERKTTKTRLKKPKPRWAMQGRIYGMAYDKPIDYHLSVRTKTPQVVTPEYEPGLRVEPGHKDATVSLVQQAAYTLNDLWVRYGPDRPWPQNGVHHDWICNTCFAGPNYRNICPAWQ